MDFSNIEKTRHVTRALILSRARHQSGSAFFAFLMGSIVCFDRFDTPPSLASMFDYPKSPMCPLVFGQSCFVRDDVPNKSDKVMMIGDVQKTSHTTVSSAATEAEFILSLATQLSILQRDLDGTLFDIFFFKKQRNIDLMVRGEDISLFSSLCSYPRVR